MLYNLNWLQRGKPYPPMCERARITRYAQNASLFDNNQFSNDVFRHRTDYPGVLTDVVGAYDACCERIAKVVGNFADIVSVPVLLNYQRFMSLKMADLVTGEYPVITGKDAKENAKIKYILDSTSLFEKLYAIVIDLSRYGDCPIRIYKDEYTDFYDFTLWQPAMWQPIVAQDGTNRVTHHVLSWVVNTAPSESVLPHYELHAQIYDVHKPSVIRNVVFDCGSDYTVIGELVDSYEETTGFDSCPVFSLRAFATSGTVYGYDDYVPLDAIMTEIITRVSQISAILDKHADPAMTGPYSMLHKDPQTGELVLEASKFYGINAEDTPPSYLTWDGKLEAAFKQLEFLINQLYILSEMGAALTGGMGENSNAVSGNAMRFKLVNPLAKARRVSNALTLPLRKLISTIGSNMPDIDPETGEPGNGDDTPLPYSHISINWQDGLPDDPREQLENAKLACGEQSMLPLEDALMTYLSKSQAEATDIAQRVRELAAKAKEIAQQNTNSKRNDTDDKPVNHAGIQDGTGVNPTRNGGKTKNFQAENNKKPAQK